MTVKVGLFFILMISLTVTANLLMKLGAAPSERLIFGMVSIRTLLGLVAFGCAGLVYAWILRWLPLNVAQAIAAAQFIAVILASAVVLSESIPPMRWLGIALIAVGIALVGATTNDRPAEYDTNLHAAGEDPL